MNHINFQEGVNAGTPKPCTIEQLNALLDSPQVAQICKQIAELDPNSPDYNDRKQALKKRLPILLPHASAFKNGRRKSEDAIPSGQAMLDVDHVEDPRGWFNSIEQQLLIDNHINLVAQTASGHGLRIVGERFGGESIEQAQVRMAAALGITVKTLDEPNMVTIFIGIVLGLLLGSVPFFVPGMSYPVRLGLAGGPIVMGILIGAYGPRFHMVAYTTTSANAHSITLPSLFMIRKLCSFVNMGRSALPHHYIFLSQPLAALRQQRRMIQAFPCQQLTGVSRPLAA